MRQADVHIISMLRWLINLLQSGTRADILFALSVSQIDCNADFISKVSMTVDTYLRLSRLCRAFMAIVLLHMLRYHNLTTSVVFFSHFSL